MLRKFIYPLLLVGCLLTACSTTQEQDNWDLTPDSLQHASLFSIARADSFTVVDVKSAWTEGETLQRYILIPDSAPLPYKFPQGTLLRTPLRRAVMHNAVHAAIVAELGCANAIKGICDVEYVQTPLLQRLLDAGYIADAGSSVQSDVERYISLRADAVFTSPIEHASYGMLEKVGLPLVECLDYMETSALGRAEWIRFWGLLFGCEDRANQFFQSVAEEYSALCDTVKQRTKSPRIMTDVINGSAWNMPGGKSYLGGMFADAGADYILADDTHSGSVPLNFETVYTLAHNADFWLIKQARTSTISYRELRRDHASYATFAPWKNRKIYFCNTLSTDYYERTPYHPEILLRELIHLLHPELFNTPYTPQYFLPIP